MKQYTTTIEIAASADAVWHALTVEMPRAPQAFGILRLEGQIEKGAKIKLWSEVSPNRAFPLRVTVLDAPRRMVWRGGMPLGLFVGTRTFEIEVKGDTSLFTMSEVFTGPMAGLITRSIPDLTPSFKKFAAALKEKAETHD